MLLRLFIPAHVRLRKSNRLDVLSRTWAGIKSRNTCDKLNPKAEGWSQRAFPKGTSTVRREWLLNSVAKTNCASAATTLLQGNVFQNWETTSWDALMYKQLSKEHKHWNVERGSNEKSDKNYSLPATGIWKALVSETPRFVDGTAILYSLLWENIWAGIKLDRGLQDTRTHSLALLLMSGTCNCKPEFGQHGNRWFDFDLNFKSNKHGIL